MPVRGTKDDVITRYLPFLVVALLSSSITIEHELAQQSVVGQGMGDVRFFDNATRAQTGPGSVELRIVDDLNVASII